jgi:pimeloyl-ACP methyl ester carboxylesterase
MQLKLIKLTVIFFLLFVVISRAQSVKTAPVFVLVPGAWHGGWSWQYVSAKLREQGNVVYTPTLSGLGEHKNQPHDNIDLDTHITDIVNLLVIEDLHEVVLVGHSYAGVVIAGVADRVPERISKLVFLDAVIAENGQSVLSVHPEAAKANFIKAASKYHMLSMAPLPAAIFGVNNPQQQHWVDERLTPQPYKTFTQPLALKHQYGNHLPMIYIACTNPQMPVLRPFAEKTKLSAAWKYYALDTGHDAMVTVPDELAALLISVSK